MTPAAKGGTVETAVLVERLDTAITMIGALTAKVEESNKCQNDMNARLVKVETRQDAQAEEVKALKSRDLLGTVGATLLGLGAALLWLFK